MYKNQLLDEDKKIICNLIHNEYLYKMNYCPSCNKTMNIIIQELENQQSSYCYLLLKFCIGFFLPIEIIYYHHF